MSGRVRCPIVTLWVFTFLVVWGLLGPLLALGQIPAAPRRPLFTKWTTFYSAEGRFSLDFPEPPTPISRTSEAKGMTLTWRGFYVQRPDRILGVRFVMVPPTSVPKFRTPEARREQTLDAFVDGAIAAPDAKRLGVTVKSRTAMRLLDRYPGRQLVLTYNNGLVGEARAFLVDDVIYLLEFEHPASENPGIDTELFFRSFRLATQGIPASAKRLPAP